MRYAVGTALGVAAVVFVIFNRYARDLPSSLVAVLLMMTLGFVFAAVSGYLVGVIGVSSNPTSGLTVSVLIIVAFIMVLMGLKGTSGISAVLLVAAFTCVSVSVAGEMMQDLKAGHILGGTPWRMQLGDMLGVLAASLVMFFVLSVLHLGNIKQTVAGKLGELDAAGVTEVTYDGRHPALAAGTYRLEDIKAHDPRAAERDPPGQRGFRRREDPRAPGQPDGGRGQGHLRATDGMDPDPDRRVPGAGPHPDAGPKPDADRGRDVPAHRNFVRHLRGRGLQIDRGEPAGRQ